MRSAVLILAAGLAVAAGYGMWLAVTPDSLENRAEDLLDRDGAASRPDATRLLREALARDPAAPYRWCRLGEALDETGQRRTARYCFLRAAELGPNLPPVLMRAANFHFASGAAADGLACTRRVLALVRDYDAVIFASWSRLGVPEEEVLARGFPPVHGVRAAYFRYVLDRGSAAQAARCWSWLECAGEADAPAAAGYTSFLLKQREYEAAAAQWQHSLGDRSPDFLRPNRVFNGGFEADPGAGALDWCVTPSPGVAVSRDTGTAHAGANSLRLEFDGGSKVAYHHVAQRVVAPPGRYRFRALVRTERLTTDQRIRFRIFDSASPAQLEAATAQAAATSGWTELTARLTVPAPTRLLAIEVTRDPSLQFDNRFSGRVWIDDVELVPDR
ncbi:MAG TPA: hypothetical protein VHA11_02260 [Bryobacteraceae bacterium]|nr:hypothetical protein [Bryobacteraceae bacterium]